MDRWRHDELNRQTVSGFRCHVRGCPPGLITHLSLAPANASDLAVLPEVVEGTAGFAVGDRNSWSPKAAAELRATGLLLLVPYRSAKTDPDLARSRFLSRVRYRIDTTFGQPVERDHAKRFWARDLWYLSSRLLRQVLSHTVAVLLNHGLGNSRSNSPASSLETRTRGYLAPRVESELLHLGIGGVRLN